MHYAQRVTLGLVIILSSFILLWFGSPARSGAFEPSPVFAWAFVVVFAIGFVLCAAGLMGMKDDYPALLSGLVLYFIVGGLISIVLYINGPGIGRSSLVDWGDPNFWIHWVRTAATWPLVLVQRADLFGYGILHLF